MCFSAIAYIISKYPFCTDCMMALKQQVKNRLMKISPRTFPILLGRYLTRACVVLVWCGVLWAFVGTSAFPKVLVDNQQGGELMCLTADEARNVSLQLQEWNFTETMLTVHDQNSNNSYEVIVVNTNGSCKNVVRVRNIEIMEDGSGVEENMTSYISSLSINLPQQMGLLYIPDGHFFGLAALFIFASFCGFLAKLVFLPPLCGMIVAGFMLRNVPGIKFVQDINPVWSSTIRNVALVVVLTRGGLSLNLKQLKQLKLALVLLALLPCTLEGAIDGVVGTFYLRMPWQWAFMLGWVFHC